MLQMWGNHSLVVAVELMRGHNPFYSCLYMFTAAQGSKCGKPHCGKRCQKRTSNSNKYHAAITSEISCKYQGLTCHECGFCKELGSWFDQPWTVKRGCTDKGCTDKCCHAASIALVQNRYKDGGHLTQRHSSYDGFGRKFFFTRTWLLNAGEPYPEPLTKLRLTSPFSTCPL